jgi:hypothetical protein
LEDGPAYRQRLTLIEVLTGEKGPTALNGIENEPLKDTTNKILISTIASRAENQVIDLQARRDFSA